MWKVLNSCDEWVGRAIKGESSWLQVLVLLHWAHSNWSPPPSTTSRRAVESWLDHSTRKRCDNHLSVGENWHCANSGSECIYEEGLFTEWKLGNTPNEKPKNPAFGGVFFCLRIKKERFLIPLPCRVSCVSSTSPLQQGSCIERNMFVAIRTKSEIAWGRLLSTIECAVIPVSTSCCLLGFLQRNDL